jgi:hypothetical protein
LCGNSPGLSEAHTRGLAVWAYGYITAVGVPFHGPAEPQTSDFHATLEMTIDTRTEAERRYNAECSGELYVKPESHAITQDWEYATAERVLMEELARHRARADAMGDILEEIDGGEREPAPMPFGQLADGTHPLLDASDD